MVAAPGSGIPRRRALVGLLLVPPALSGCALGGSATSRPTDPLIALADAARADAALTAAAIAADAALAERMQPLVDARTAHAAALDAEVQRLRPNRNPIHAGSDPARRRGGTAGPGPGGGPGRPPTPPPAAALDLPVDRVGLVASIAACCAGYATVLT